MEPLTKEQLQAIRERAEAATPGPWRWRSGALHTDDDFTRLHGNSMWDEVLHFCDDALGLEDLVGGEYIRSYEDAEFIAHAREDVPALLEHIDTQGRRIERMRRALDDAHEELKARLETIQSLQAALRRRDGG